MYSKNIHKKIFPASLTKLMTALLLIDKYNLTDLIEINLPEGYLYEGKVAYLTSGQVVNVETLLEFILIYSANDACFAAALSVSGSVDNFVSLMNLKADELGMNNTNFTNPDGLDDINHFTTLNDLVLLSKEILKNYELVTLIIKPSFISNIQGSDKLYKNTNKLIKDDYIGLKTGWTNEAGLTFIGLNQTNNRNILTIVNKSIVNENKDNHFIDTKILYKESIENFDKISIIDKDQDIYQVRNSSKAKIIKAKQEWSMFANKSSQNTIYLENFNIDKLQFKTNDEKLSIKIVDTEDKILWKFDFLKLLKLIANQ